MISFILAHWDQLLIAATGVSAIFLTQFEHLKYRRWAPVLGLIGQAGWFHSAGNAGQWGIFILCFFYTAAWVKGFWTFWLQPWAEKARRG